MDGVFSVLSNNGLFLNIKKSTFAESTVKFFSHSVGINAVDVLSTKAKTTREYPMPITRKDLKHFLGMVNYYNRFPPRIAEIMEPLSKISGGPRKTNKLMLNLNE